MAAPVAKGSLERYGWVLVFLVAIIIVINGLYVFITAAEPDAQAFKSTTGVDWSAFVSSATGLTTFVQNLLRFTGLLVTIAGAFAAAIAYTAFRRGERWAFYILFLAPLGLLYSVADDRSGSTWPIYLVLLIVNVIGLLMPYRKFFPRK